MRRLYPQTLLAILLLQTFETTLSASSSKSDDQKELKHCTAYNEANGNFYDLNKIAIPPLVDHKKAHKDDREESWHARGWDYGTNFTINFCAPVIESLKNVEGIKEDKVQNISAFYKTGEKTYSIGFVRNISKTSIPPP